MDKNKQPEDMKVTSPNPGFTPQGNVKGEELSCILVHSDPKHISNYQLAPIIDFIKETLESLGFKPRLVSEEVRDGEDHIDCFIKIAKECVYGVVILDGFRPNVLLELGILFALEKPISILMSNDAEISVKGFYNNKCEEAGLTEKQFNQLKNPKIKLVECDLSDLLPHVTIFNPGAYKNAPDHVSVRLKESIKRNMEEITKEYMKISTKEVQTKIKTEDLIKKHHAYTLDIFTDLIRLYFVELITLYLGHYLQGEEFSEELIELKYKNLKDVEREADIKFPSGIRSLIGSLFVILATREKDPHKARKYYYRALELYEEGLKFETKDIQKAEIQQKIGNVYGILSQTIEPAENCKKAIKAYEEALKVYTRENFPLEYARINNNLGFVYRTLGETEATGENCKKAIKACEESLQVYTLEDYPLGYAMAQNNLGSAYATLAQVEAKGENCKKAIKAYEEALKVYTRENFPLEYAGIKNNLGFVYRMLGEVYLLQGEIEATGENCKKAIKACEESLQVYTLEDYPLGYAMAQNNLGSAYATLAQVEAKGENCKKAIKAYEEVLRVISIDSFPLAYAMIQQNLGGVYSTLADVEAKAENCKKAIKACEEALRVYTFDRFPIKYGSIQNNLGIAYCKLAEVEAREENCKKAMEAFAEAIKIFTEDDYPEIYTYIVHNIKKLSDFCKNK